MLSTEVQNDAETDNIENVNRESILIQIILEFASDSVVIAH